MVDYNKIRGGRFRGAKLAPVTAHITFNNVRNRTQKRINTGSLIFIANSYFEMGEL